MTILKIMAASGAAIVLALAGCSSSGGHNSGYGGYSSSSNPQTAPSTSGNCQTGTGYSSSTNCQTMPSGGNSSSGGGMSGGGGGGY
jgi:hypothetical protein